MIIDQTAAGFHPNEQRVCLESHDTKEIRAAQTETEPTVPPSGGSKHTHLRIPLKVKTLYFGDKVKLKFTYFCPSAVR